MIQVFTDRGFAMYRLQLSWLVVWLQLSLSSAETYAQTSPTPETDVAGSVFDWTANDEYVCEDETPDGQARLQELVAKAKQLIDTRMNVLRERRAPAQRRDYLAACYASAAEQLQRANTLVVNCNNEAAKLKRNMGLLNGAMLQNAQQRLSVLQSQIQSQQPVIQSNLADQRRWEPEITALNASLKPLDDRLSQIWNELEETRKQWLKIRDPMSKYAMGEFETLRKVLDDWLKIDGLWPEAHLWAALCAYELGDYEDATEYLDKTDDVRVNTLNQRDEWASVLGLRYLVGRKSATRVKGNNSNLEKCENINKKSPHPFVHFLVGTSYVDQKQFHAKAAVNFNEALKLKPKYVCAQVALARLQTTSPHEKLAANADAGLETLLKVYNQTGKRSWRLARYVAEAYYNAGQRDRSVEFWKVVLSSKAPVSDKAEADRRIREATEVAQGPAVAAPAAAVPAQAVAAAKPVPAAAVRNWTNTSNKVIQASLKGVFVKLKLVGKPDAIVDLSQLSRQDRTFVEQQISAAQFQAPTRNWTNSSGAKIAAALDDVSVKLAMNNGKDYMVAVSDLVKSDQKEVAKALK